MNQSDWYMNKPLSKNLLNIKLLKLVFVSETEVEKKLKEM